MFFYLIFLMNFFKSIKEINRYAKHLLLRKTDILKTLILSKRKFEDMHYFWRAKMYINRYKHAFTLLVSHPPPPPKKGSARFTWEKNWGEKRENTIYHVYICTYIIYTMIINYQKELIRKNSVCLLKNLAIFFTEQTYR